MICRGCLNNEVIDGLCKQCKKDLKEGNLRTDGYNYWRTQKIPLTGKVFHPDIILDLKSNQNQKRRESK